MPHWLRIAEISLMVSHVRLRRRKSLPRAIRPWVLDSGGFSELSLHGEWTIPTDEYVQSVRRYHDEIGNMVWAAPQDWMCEPWMVEKTTLSIEEHQRRTIDNYLDLVERAPDIPWIPVLQGWTIDDYHRHAEDYSRAGIDLTTQPTVGIGSVCRRQGTTEAATIIRSLWATEIHNLHGFGFKILGLREVGGMMASADSIAWTINARHALPLPECNHKQCQNCLLFALQWREKVLSNIPDEFQAALV
jgi:hypothetical protein